MSESDHERWSGELPAYLLGALEPSEAEALARHLGGCERCRTEVRWLIPALDALPQTVERVPAPPQLRQRLMAEVREDARNQRAAEPRRRGLAERLRETFGGSPWRPLVAGAAVLLIAAAVVGYEVGSGDSGGSGNAATVVSESSKGGVLAAVSTEDGHGRIRLTNVGPLPHDRVLEAWVERDGSVEAVPTLFVPNGKGEAATTLGDMRGVSTVMVTREPPGGSRAPTSTPIAEVPIPQT